MERFESLEFHYNDLIKKHKLCLECLQKQKKDYETLKTDYCATKVYTFLTIKFEYQ
jgi:hypothetical protein